MRKVALGVFILLLLGAGGWIGFSIYKRISEEKAAPERPQRPAVAVETAPVTTGTIRDIRRLTGTLSAAFRADISPKITGRIERIEIDLGDRVSQGQIIARLDRDELEEDVSEARSNLDVAVGNRERALAEVEQAQREYDRIAQLQSRQVASESDLDAARLALNVRQANLRVADAEVAQRQAALRSAEIRLTYTNIKAEWEQGTATRIVAARHVEEGELVSANETIVSLVDLSTLNVLMYVTERDYPLLKIGQEVEVTADPFPGTKSIGHVARLSPRFEETSRQARIEVTVENTDELLKPGMFVIASVLLREKNNVTMVPTRALVRREGQYGLFVANRQTNTADYVPVTIGIEEAGKTEIVEPVIEGEVITLGQNLIEPETPLTFVDSAPARTAPSEVPVASNTQVGSGS